MTDVILVLMILLLSVKGFFNGFIREMVGFVGLVGGVFVASRAAKPIGNAIGNLIHTDNIAMLKLTGFLLILALVWGGSSFVATIFTALKSEPRTPLARSLGMGVAGVKYFFIFSMIIASLFNNDLIRNHFAKSIQTSYLFPVLNTMGLRLTNIAPLPSIMTSTKEKI